LLLNRTSHSYSYVLRSETGAALIIDYGYDMHTGLPPGGDRAARRPWLASLPALRRNHGVTSIEVALPTHYHDDHVAGMNLLREVEGTEVWAPANVAEVLEAPMVENLPCTWFDPIPVDRRLALGESFRWHEYEIFVPPPARAHALRGGVRVRGRRDQGARHPRSATRDRRARRSPGTAQLPVPQPVPDR
jgi:glyoxylase-like metal-dependent hydrolase (beta-lactamase superfamily II)